MDELSEFYHEDSRLRYIRIESQALLPVASFYFQQDHFFGRTVANDRCTEQGEIAVLVIAVEELAVVAPGLIIGSFPKMSVQNKA